MDFQFEPEKGEGEEPGKIAGLANFLGKEGMPQEGDPVQYLNLPMMPGGGVGPGSDKPTLHVGPLSHPYTGWQGTPTIAGETKEKDNVYYDYDETFKPAKAQIYSATTDDIKSYKPDEINFPPHPETLKQVEWEPAKPVLHVGELDTSKFSLAMNPSVKGITPQGGTVFYEYTTKGKPLYAVIYGENEQWETSHYPENIYFPPAPKTSFGQPLPESKPTLHVGPLKKTFQDLFGNSTVVGETEKGENVYYAYNHKDKPVGAEVYSDSGLKNYTPDEINFPPHPEPSSFIEPSVFSDPEYEEEPIEEPYKPPEDKAYPKFTPTEPLTEDERQAVRDYTGALYTTLADHVYHGGNDYDSSYHDEKMDLINSAIGKHPLPEAMQLYRGVSNDVFSKFARAQPGESQVQTGFLSASTQEYFADNWRSGKRFILEVPAGMKGLPVDSFSIHEGEKEIIFQLGTKLEMIGRPDNNTLHFKVVPRETRAKWVEPPENNLEQEYNVEYLKHFRTNEFDPFPEDKTGKYNFIGAVKEAPVVTITKEQDKQIQNRSRASNIEELLNLIKGYVSYPQYRNEKTLEELKKRIIGGSSIHMPIVIKLPDGQMRILSGNTRLDINFMHHNEADVKLLDLSRLGHE